jgi:hypothetical protein
MAGPALAFPAIGARAAAAGVALVIGNSKYRWEASLPNVRRDAPDVARALQALGLRTELVEDAGRDAMRAAIDKFIAAARGANFAALYFAGHGVTWDKSYLVPVDSDLSDPGAVGGLIVVPSIFEPMNQVAHSLLVFDNCRNNPADGWRQKAAEQQADINARQQDAIAGRVPNLLMLFSTSKGHVALDGPAGQNSPFAAAFLRQLGGEAVELRSLAGNLRRDLLIATRGRQVLTSLDSYSEPFPLKGPRGAGGAGSPGSSGVIELANAYAYAQQNKIPLPAGLVALRPAGEATHGPKVGSFKFAVQGWGDTRPELLVVMSVDRKDVAEVILAGNEVNGGYWRFITAAISADRLEFVPHARSARWVFDWRDANSGSMAIIGGKSPVRFTRLDG